MNVFSFIPLTLRPALVWLLALGLLMPMVAAQEAPEPAAMAGLEQALVSAGDGASEARRRLAVRRVIRDAEKMLKDSGDAPQRWTVLEFLFRASQQLIALDDDSKHRQALLEICRKLVKAPDEFAGLRLEADLLLSQAEQVKKAASVRERAEALRPFVARYVDTPASAKALRMAMVIALELGDTRLVNDLREIIAEHFASDLEMITFLRDHLGGQVFGVPFVGAFKRSDGKTVCFPMDGLGHSLMVLFWSKEDAGALQYLTDLAAASLKDQNRVDGHLEFISVNLDELPDAGESIIRGMGVDWQVLHFPGGRENPIYDAYVRVDPLNMRVAPTGQTAMMMREARKKPAPPDRGETPKKLIPSPDFERYIESFRRTLIRGWSRDAYALNLAALMTGDFLVFDPEGGIDPTRPPELKAAAMGGKVKALPRGADSLPEQTLMAIQSCLIAPPQRYHASVPEIRAGYRKMVERCRKAIADHPHAPDLWMVRNRLIIALMGLWKTDFELAHFEAAVAEATAALDAGYPAGTDVIARFCLARQALRDPAADAGQVIDGLVADQGGENAPGPAFAVAALLALDVADEARFQKYRDAIVKNHTEYPMMWIFSGFLLDRYHDYWLFQVPFTAGWSFDRRLKHEMARGEAEEASRLLEIELPTMDGKVFRIPEDLEAEFTAIFFAQPGPWRGNDREDQRPSSPGRIMRGFPNFAVSRPDVDAMVAMLAEGDAAAIRETIQARRSDKQLESPILQVPGGMSHPLVHRLGLLSENEGAVMVDKQGRILTVISGIPFGSAPQALENTVLRQDEKAVSEALERGEIQAAKERIMALAPPYDPEAVDERGRKLRKPKYSLPHLRARARVYMALKQWDKALADAEVVLKIQLGAAGGMSLRTDELDESEALRDSILKHMKSATPGSSPSTR